MNFLVVGNGLIGKCRINALLRLKKETDLVNKIYVYDVVTPTNLPDGVEIPNDITFMHQAPDWVIIATPHHVAKDWVQVASSWDSKILLEKPMGRTYEEAKEIFALCKPDQLYLGFNYRFYPLIQKLYNDVINNEFGELVSINMILGHGGSPQDKDSWKLNTTQGSDSSLLDPGIHFLDLLNSMFPRRAIPMYGKSWTGFWDKGAQEELHLLLSMNNIPVNIQTSLVKWQSTFHIEINGTNGYGIIDGKGRSYGEQTYKKGKRWAWECGKPQMETVTTIRENELPYTCDDSFYLELKSLLVEKYPQNCNAQQALDVMKLYNNCRKVTCS